MKRLTVLLDHARIRKSSAQDQVDRLGSRLSKALAIATILLGTLAMTIVGAPLRAQQDPMKFSGEDYPAPPPPSPPLPTPSPAPMQPEVPQRPKSALDRYQDCFQRMIDAGVSENEFMRRCLGLNERSKEKVEEGRSLNYLTREDVQLAFQKDRNALRACYTKLLTATKALGVTPQGQLELKFAVLPQGSVENLHFGETTLSDATMLACIRTQVSTWKFETIAERREVRLAMRFVPSKARAATVSLAKGFPQIESVAFQYPPEEILGVFQKNSRQVRRCHDDLARRKPGLGGVVSVDVQVEISGRVERVSLRENTVPDPSFRDCLIGAIKKWRFPRPKSGEKVLVSYPPWTFAPVRTEAAPPKAPPL